MKNLIYPNGTTLVIAQESQHQSTIAFQAVVERVAHGDTAVCLVDSANAGAAIVRQAEWILRALELPAEHGARIIPFKDHHLVRVAGDLAAKINRITREREGDLIIFGDFAADMNALHRGDYRLGRLAALPSLLECSVVCTAHTGSAQMPAPQFSDLARYDADAIWKCIVRKHGAVTLSPVKPAGSADLKLTLRNVLGNMLLLVDDEMEDAHEHA